MTDYNYKDIQERKSLKYLREYNIIQADEEIPPTLTTLIKAKMPDDTPRQQVIRYILIIMISLGL